MQQALSNYRILGLPNNLTFLRRVIEHPAFRENNYDTNFIATHKETLLKKET